MRFSDCLTNARDRHKYDAYRRKLGMAVHDSVDFLIAAWDILADAVASKECPSHATVLMQYRNVIELLDGVEILVREGSSFNCFHLLRSTWEAYWGILWVLAEDTERRGKAYQVWHAHRTIAFASRFDESTDAHARLRARVGGQEHSHIFEGTEVDSAGVRDRKLKLLSLPEYRETAAAWDEAVAQRKGKPGLPAWHSLFNGPKHAGELAACVGQRVAYEVYYGFYSDAVHAGNAFDHIAPSGDANGNSVRPIRHPEWLAKVSCQAIQLGVCVVQVVLKDYAPQHLDTFRERYAIKLRPAMQELAKGEQLFAPWS